MKALYTETVLKIYFICVGPRFTCSVQMVTHKHFLSGLLGAPKPLHACWWDCAEQQFCRVDSTGLSSTAPAHAKHIYRPKNTKTNKKTNYHLKWHVSVAEITHCIHATTWPSSFKLETLHFQPYLFLSPYLTILFFLSFFNITLSVFLETPKPLLHSSSRWGT